LGKARPAFGGCNVELCHGGNRGDSWESGPGSATVSLEDSKLRLDLDFFEGAVVVAARGAADAAPCQSPSLPARRRLGLVETCGNARETSNFNSGPGAVVLAAHNERRSPANAGDHRTRPRGVAERAQCRR